MKKAPAATGRAGPPGQRRRSRWQAAGLAEELDDRALLGQVAVGEQRRQRTAVLDATLELIEHVAAPHERDDLDAGLLAQADEAFEEAAGLDHLGDDDHPPTALGGEERPDVPRAEMAGGEHAALAAVAEGVDVLEPFGGRGGDHLVAVHGVQAEAVEPVAGVGHVRGADEVVEVAGARVGDDPARGCGDLVALAGSGGRGARRGRAARAGDGPAAPAASPRPPRPSGTASTRPAA